MAAGDEGDHIAPIGEAFRRGRVVKSTFSAERWDQFKHDVRVIRDWKKGMDAELWRQMVQDHGYNGTPAWTLQATPLVRLVPVEFLKVLAYADVALLSAALGALWRLGGCVETVSGRVDVRSGVQRAPGLTRRELSRPLLRLAGGFLVAAALL
ncbi:MAG: hypothetical protein EXR71_11980 [Myxococcales bacterium]|nr:hypothetical protein [Myxococcales bacterium]